jgi:hypothetical protein
MTAAVVSASAAHAGPAGGSTTWVASLASVGVVLAFVFVAPWLAARSVRRRQPGDDESDGSDGRGGGGPGRGPTPPGRPPDGDSEWWPEFERQFEAYVKSELAEPPATRG